MTTPDTMLYTVKLSLPDIENSPTFAVDVHARDDDQAIDRAFDKAFAAYPQFGAFKVDDVTERAAEC